MLPVPAFIKTPFVACATVKTPPPCLPTKSAFFAVSSIVIKLYSLALLKLNKYKTELED